MSQFLFDVISGLRKNLANLPVGRMPILVSEWGHEISVVKLTEYKGAIRKYEKVWLMELEPEITKLLDITYQ